MVRVTQKKKLAIVRVTNRKAPFTAAHEILHLLGVEHDDSTENIMDPHLNDDDILAWFYDEAWTSETINKLTNKYGSVQELRSTFRQFYFVLVMFQLGTE